MGGKYRREKRWGVLKGVGEEMMGKDLEKCGERGREV